jgi:TetR/AcrR family transcriptional repressor of mexJK operon
MDRATVVSSTKNSKRLAILVVAKSVFVEHGYDVSMDRIAEAAGVARRTIFYNFDSKEQLLAEIIEQMSSAAVPDLVPDRNQDLTASLMHFAEAYVASVSAPESAMLYRLLVSGTPNLGVTMRNVLDRNYRQIVHALAADFKSRIAAGEMKMVNPDFAAERFLTSVLGFARLELMLGIAPDLTAHRSYLRDAVIGFLHGVTLAPNGPEKDDDNDGYKHFGGNKNANRGKKRLSM